MKTSRVAMIFGRCAIVITVLLMACGIWFLLGYLKFHNRLKELRANGSLIPLNEIVHEVADPQKDALTFLKQVFPVANEYAKAIQRDSFGRAKVETEALRKFEELNSKHPEFFKLISTAANSPEMSFGLDSNQTTSYGILDVQNILLVMEWKGQVLLSRGDQLGAIEVAQEMLLLSKLVEKPILLNALAGKAFQNVACHLIFESLMIGPIDAQLGRQIRQLLEELDLDAVHQNVLRSELSLFLDQTVGSNLQNGVLGQRPLWAPLLSFSMPTAFGNRLLDQIDVAFERARLPLSIQFPKNEKRSSWNILPDPVGDSTELYNTLRNSFGQIKVRQRCVLILLALMTEVDSASRTEWSIDYLKSIGVSGTEAIDPFSDQPLIIRRKDGRWAIHSVGPNQQDDQGQQGSDDIGLGLIQKVK